MNVEGKPHKKKNPGGRPKASPGTLKSHSVGVRFTEAEKEKLSSIFPHGELAPYMRACALGKLGTAKMRKTVPELNKSAWIELSKPLANLNQIAHRVNSGETVDGVEILEQIEQCREMIAELRSQILTGREDD